MALVHSCWTNNAYQMEGLNVSNKSSGLYLHSHSTINKRFCVCSGSRFRSVPFASQRKSLLGGSCRKNGFLYMAERSKSYESRLHVISGLARVGMTESSDVKELLKLINLLPLRLQGTLEQHPDFESVGL